MNQVAPSHRFGHMLFLVGAFSLILSSVFFAPMSSQNVAAFGATDIISMTNEARTQLNGESLKPNTQLTSAAQAKADDMAKQRYFAHTAPNGTMAWDYIKDTTYAYDIAGENLAITNESAETVIAAWMKSPSHRDNITNQQYQDIGIGIANYGAYENHDDTVVIVALYASAAPTQTVGATTNPAGGTAVLQSSVPLPPLGAITIAAVGLLCLGVWFEMRHVRKLHRHLA